MAVRISERKNVVPLPRESTSIDSVLKRCVIFLVLDRTGKIIDAGTRYLEMVGMGPADVSGQDFLGLHQPRTSRDIADIWNDVLKGATWRGEMQIFNLPGNHYWLDVTLSLMTQADGDVRVALVAHDVSPYRKESEDKAHWLNSNLWLEKVKKNYLAEKDNEKKPGRPLSLRETQVLKFVAEGLANKNIATELGISVRTVEIHRAHLMRKLGIRNTANLVKFALDHGYVS